MNDLPFLWVAGLSPSLGAPNYAATVEVSRPFNSAFPDFSYQATVAQHPPSSDMFINVQQLTGYNIVPQPARMNAAFQ